MIASRQAQHLITDDRIHLGKIVHTVSSVSEPGQGAVLVTTDLATLVLLATELVTTERTPR